MTYKHATIAETGNPNERVHIYPLRDTQPHSKTIDCACRPMQDCVMPNLIIHNAFDGREEFETAKDRIEIIAGGTLVN